MLNNHRSVDQNISFLGKHFFLLVIGAYLYHKQLNQHANKSLVLDYMRTSLPFSIVNWWVGFM